MHKPVVLFVEDDEQILNSLSLALVKENFDVIPAKSAEVALEILETSMPDIILLDLNLPEMNGTEFAALCKENIKLREIPIVIITGVNFEDIIVKALEDYADDYITKPVRPRVVKARLQAVLRRTIGEIEGERSEPISLNTQHFEAFLQGEKLLLTRSEYNILQFLFQNPNKPFSREQIIKAIRGDSYHVESRSLDFQIFGLRKKLGEFAHLIETVRGIGFRYKADN